MDWGHLPQAYGMISPSRISMKIGWNKDGSVSTGQEGRSCYARWWWRICQCYLIWHRGSLDLVVMTGSPNGITGGSGRMSK